MNDETARPAGPDWAALPGEAPPRPGWMGLGQRPRRDYAVRVSYKSGMKSGSSPVETK